MRPSAAQTAQQSDAANNKIIIFATLRLILQLPPPLPPPLAAYSTAAMFFVVIPASLLMPSHFTLAYPVCHRNRSLRKLICNCAIIGQPPLRAFGNGSKELYLSPQAWYKCFSNLVLCVFVLLCVHESLRWQFGSPTYACFYIS